MRFDGRTGSCLTGSFVDSQSSHHARFASSRHRSRDRRTKAVSVRTVRRGWGEPVPSRDGGGRQRHYNAVGVRLRKVPFTRGVILGALNVDTSTTPTATLREATTLLESSAARLALISGGTDLLGELKDSTAAPRAWWPSEHLKELQGIRRLRRSDDRRRHAARRHRRERRRPARRALLAMAAGTVGTPQIRNMGTIGGNLCRGPAAGITVNNYPCFKHGGNACFSATGENDYHAILEAGPSFIVHPSDTAPALVALGATVRIATRGRERTVPIESFSSPTPGSGARKLLLPDEILAEIDVPNAPAGSRAIYGRNGGVRCGTLRSQRRGDGDRAQGGVRRRAHVAGRCGADSLPGLKTEAAITGRRSTKRPRRPRAPTPLDGARPLAKNGYKVPLTQAVVKRSILSLA